MSIKKSYELRLLTCNDVYRPNKFSALKAMIPKHQGRGVTKVVLPGDFLGGSLFSVSHEGKSMIEVCNQVGFDYVTLGNHEFDFGSEKLEGLMGLSNFKWLGSNVRYSDSNKIFSKTLDYDIFTIPSAKSNNHKVINVHFSELLDYWKVSHVISEDSIKVGVFGVCTQFTPQLSNPGDAVLFEDVLDHTRRLVKHLKYEEKCDIIIALTHVPIAEDKLIAEVGNIDLILGGHDHEPYIIEHREVLIMKCGQNIDYLGVIDLHIDCVFKRGKLNDLTKNITVNRSLQLVSTYNVKGDAKIDSIIEKWNRLTNQGMGDSEHAEVLTIVDAHSDRSLSTKTSDCRRSETAFPCILADSYKWLCEQEGLPCDFAIQNGGFVRADSVYPPGTSITKSIIKEELPFVKKPILLQMPGSAVVEALTDMLPNTINPPPLGSYPHLSSGITASYDLNYVANGRPSKVFNVKVNGEDIIPDKLYNVATTSFYVHEAADGVTAFNNKTVIKEFEMVCSEAMCKYLPTLSSISGEPPSRLINATK